MIAYSHFRRGWPDGREPLAPPGEVSSLAANYTPSQATWGKLTSKRPPRMSREDLELTAFRLGCSVAAARRALELGLLDG